MAGAIANYSKVEGRAMVIILQTEKFNQNEVHRKLVNIYGMKDVGQKEVSVSCNEFIDGRSALMMIQRNGDRPRASHSDENFVIVEDLIREDRRVKIREKHCEKQLCHNSRVS
jgi:hypothetical protein